MRQHGMDAWGRWIAVASVRPVRAARTTMCGVLLAHAVLAGCNNYQLSAPPPPDSTELPSTAPVPVDPPPGSTPPSGGAGPAAPGSTPPPPGHGSGAPPAYPTIAPPPPPPPIATVDPGPAGLPAFPWPPPRYSALARLEREWLAPAPASSLGSVARRLEAAFGATGYGEWTYYWIPGGFAIASRFEQIQADATPMALPARWAAPPTGASGFLDQIRALLGAPPGFYRVIVFATTDQDFAASPASPTSREAVTWALSGATRLPDVVAARPYTDRHYTAALVYEFVRPVDRGPEPKVPSDWPGQQHLERAGLWRALGAR